MSRPKTKGELLQLSKENLDKLMKLVDSFSREELSREFPAQYLNRNIRDVLAHLHHWHLMFLEWYEVGMRGEKPNMPADGYTWKTLPDLNKEIHKKYSESDLKIIRELFMDSFDKIYEIIEHHSETELFEKKYYPWTGSTSLGAYLVSATSSHYDWAYKLISKCQKSF